MNVSFLVVDERFGSPEDFKLNTLKYSRNVCGEVLGDREDKGWLIFVGKWSSAVILITLSNFLLSVGSLGGYFRLE